MTAPEPGTPVPAAMTAAAGGPVTLVWVNQVGGLTGRCGDRFVKWDPVGSSEDLVAEADRLRWLAGRHPAPEVLDLFRSPEADVLVTRAVPGRSAVDPVWQARPDDAVRAIARGLRLLHALPAGDCPFDWGVPARMRVAGTVPPQLVDAPPVDRLVVCHGDACAPNTLVAEDGRFAATVDVGRLGVADRWADLAVATMSLGWNYESWDETVFWDEYGLDPDAERIAYYRALWNAT